MSESVTCEGCTHFRHDEINPAAGLGWCPLRKVSRYPEELHYCRQREVEDDGD
jgi:hypothetical protein